ncbi:hypothetical protein BBJ28_00012290 [Nothophytophthora sp. Chile5]|nr:hypothetical protein BBJ28_00012290 [Nothophytophthora sp. Chile5]
MVNFLSTATAALSFCAIASSPASATTATSAPKAWRDQFSSKLGILPTATADCFVCFYDQVNFQGSEFCVGKRSKTCTAANPIEPPVGIQSIKFGTGCELAVNALVDLPSESDNPWETISADVAATGYNETAGMVELYVEEAGRACFIGYPPYQTNMFGRCYTEDVPAVETRYRDSFEGVLLFKTPATDFDVVAYEEDNYNGAGAVQTVAKGSQATQQDTSPLSQRFTGSTGLFTETAVNPLYWKIRSVAFVAAN